MGTGQGFLVLLALAVCFLKILAFPADVEQEKQNAVSNTDWINSLESKKQDDSEIESLSFGDAHAGKDPSSSASSKSQTGLNSAHTIEEINTVNSEKIHVKLTDGDIAVDPGAPKPRSDDFDHEKRASTRYIPSLWPNGIMPYVIDSSMIDLGIEGVHQAIVEYENKTCIRFTDDLTNHTHWVTFKRLSGCYSLVGRRYWGYGSQDISIGPNCENTGIVIHEIMHAIGFKHEQSRPDRDQYVEVFWENINKGKEHNFDKADSRYYQLHGTSYDYDGVMHYGNKAFGSGKVTLQAIGDPSRVLGQRNGLSDLDVQEIKALYRCQAPDAGYTSWSDWTPCLGTVGNLFKERQRYCEDEDLSKCPGADSNRVVKETKQLTCADCKADGHWGRWSSINCSASCSYGTITRTRVCNDPEPRCNGAYCNGSAADVPIKCYEGKCNPEADDCDFDRSLSPMCQWTNEGEVPFTRRTLSTPSFETGPTKDTPTGDGYYLYLEGSFYSGSENKLALLRSKEMPAVANRLMTFKYHMQGAHITYLKLELENSEGKQVLFEKMGAQGNDWLNASVTFSSGTPYRLTFESQMGTNWQNDVAFDDIAFTDLADNNCKSDTCQNGGNCTSKIGSYKCSCTADYTGVNCESKIDRCHPNPCKNGGACVNSPGTHTCICKQGFDATTNCETAINYCKSDTCQNGGNCTSKIGSYKCSCTADYTGVNCESRIDRCLSSPCLNGGACVNSPGIHTCICKQGFSGINCETAINYCKSDTCQYGGNCTSKIGSYKCSCTADYTGVNCESRTDRCLSSPCLNGGACVNSPSTHTCICKQGFSGINCETAINYCKSDTCQNGGNCTSNIGSYKCSCTADYTGVNCESRIDRCLSSPCLNGGACVNSPGSHTCICKQGFSGINCETALNVCDSVVCQNGGSCIKTLDSYRCQCAVGYTGQHCDTTVNYCRSFTCMNNGSCTSTTTGYVCTCAAGFTGKRCETALNPCTPTTCKNNGSCIPSSNSYECFCPSGYSGRHCETVLNPCTSNTCKNNGSCIAGLGSYKCHCTSGYTGKHCETNVNPCTSDTCLNNGSCISGLGSYKCQCSVGFTGKHCETAINPCTSNTCKNGGSCIVGLGSYKCNCIAGYIGKHCETAVNASKFVDLVSCDFEAGFCSWKQHKGDKMDWTRRTGKTPSWYTGPSYDHTTKTYGHYIYTEVTGKSKGHNAILHSPEMTSDGKKRCLDFFYHMYGNGMGSFKVEIEVDGTMTELFKKSGNQANNWIQGLVNIDVASGSKFRTFFEGMRASSYKGDMAIDDIRLWAGSCPTAPDTTPSALPCLFERGFCKWMLATDGKGFWDDGKNIYTKRDESEQNDLYTNEVNTGVRADGEMNRNMKKTKKVGKTRKGKETMGGRGPRGALSGWNDDYATYTGIERDESTGTLTSPRISSFQPLCMHFFAHMYGSKIGQLAVKENNSNSEFIKFTGNQGRHWFEVKANIPEGKNMLVQIEVKQNERAVIAIDDIRVTQGKCAPKREVWKCDFSNGTCGFHNFHDACTWKIVNAIKPGVKSLQWKINNCPRKRSGEGLLIKEMKLPQRGGCLTLHYHVGQKDVCNFYVRLFEANINDHNRKRSHESRLIYFKKANSNGKDGVYKKAYVTIPPARENSDLYDVEFEAKLRNYGRNRCREVNIDKMVLKSEICGNQ